MVKKNRKEKIRDLAKSYEPTPHERAALEAYRIQEEESPLAPRLRVTENDGATTICPDHPKPTVGNVLLMDARAASGHVAAAPPPSRMHITILR